MVNNFLLWTMLATTEIGKGVVALHNYIFFFYLVPILTFVLLAMIFILVDSYGNVYVRTSLAKFIANFSNVFKWKGYLQPIEAYVVKLFQEYLIKYSKTLIFLDNSTIHRFQLMAANKIVHGTLVEIVWTLLPSLILILIAIPSFALLYSMDEVVLPSQVIRAIGHQWYWSYENVGGSFNKNYRYNFDAYMVADRDLKHGDLRLLEADTTLPIPVNTHLRFLFTSTDVLHSWTVPSLGIKVDAVPGRLSQFNAYVEYNKKDLPSSKIGLELYGQCSEICGVNHGFMPISVVLV